MKNPGQRNLERRARLDAFPNVKLVSFATKAGDLGLAGPVKESGIAAHPSSDTFD